MHRIDPAGGEKKLEVDGLVAGFKYLGLWRFGLVDDDCDLMDVDALDADGGSHAAGWVLDTMTVDFVTAERKGDPFLRNGKPDRSEIVRFEVGEDGVHHEGLSPQANDFAG